MITKTEVQLKVLRYLHRTDKKVSDEAIANSTRYPKEKISKILEKLHFPNGKYVELTPKTINEKGINYWEINQEGIEYLQRLESQFSQKTQLEFNKILLIATSISALAGWYSISRGVISGFNWSSKKLEGGIITTNGIIVGVIIIALIITLIYFLFFKKKNL
jgi:hypothetical protein